MRTNESVWSHGAITALSLLSLAGAATADPIVARWLNPISADWGAASAWSTGFVPQPDGENVYAAIIDAVGGAYTINHNNLPSAYVDSLLMNSADATLSVGRIFTTPDLEIRAGVVRVRSGGRMHLMNVDLTGGSLVLAGGMITGTATIDNSGGGFQVDHASGGVLENVTVRGGSLSSGVGAGAIRIGQLGSGLVLDDVTFTGGQLTLDAAGSKLTARNGASLANTHMLVSGASASMTFEDGLSLGSTGNTIELTSLPNGSRTINLGAGSSLITDGTRSLIVASTARIAGAGEGVSFINRGGLDLTEGATLNIDESIDLFQNESGLSLTARTLATSAAVSRNTAQITLGSGGILTSTTGTFLNEGVLENIDGRITLDGEWSNTGALRQWGGTTILGGAWSNSGTIMLAGGVLRLDGVFTSDDLGSITRTGGQIAVSGVWDSTGAVTDMGLVGPITLTTGTLRGGEFIDSTGMSAWGSSARHLDGTRISVDLLDIPDQGMFLYVANGPEITGELRMSSGTLVATNDQTIESIDVVAGMRPNGTITPTGSVSIQPAGHAITLGSGSQIRGFANIHVGATSASAPRGSLRFEGTWTMPGPDAHIQLQYLDVFENAGLIEVNRFVQGNAETFLNSGTLRMTENSTLWLSERWENTGLIELHSTTSTSFSGEYTADSIRNFVMNGAEAEWGGVISIGDSPLTLDETWDYGRFNQATLQDGVLSADGNLADFVAPASFGSSRLTLRDVTLGSDLLFNGEDIEIHSGLDLGGHRFDVGGDEIATADGTRIRNGELRLNSGIDVRTAGDLTIESDASLVLDGARFGDGGTLVNEGTIRVAQGGGGTYEGALVNRGLIELLGSGLTAFASSGVQNDGLIRVSNAALAIERSLTGTGQIDASNALVRFTEFTGIPTHHPLNLVNSTIAFARCDFDLGGNEIDMRSFGSDVEFEGGRITNGTLRFGAGGAEFRNFVRIDAAIAGGDAFVRGSVTLENGFDVLDGNLRLTGDTSLALPASGLPGSGYNILGYSESLQIAVEESFTNAAGRVIDVGGFSLRSLDNSWPPVHMTNDGALRMRGISGGAGFETFEVGAFPRVVSLLNNGLIDIRNGAKLEVRDAAQYLDNFDGTTLSGGSWRVETGGRIDLVGASVRVNDASITLFGVGSWFDALYALEENSGSLNLMNGRSLSLSQAFTNSGTVRVERGLLSVDELTVTDDATIRLTLAPGARGIAWGAIDVSGHASLAGLLRIDAASSFLPVWGMTFDVIRAATLSGDFDDLILPELDDALRWHTSVVDGDYVLGIRDIADANADNVVDFTDLNAVLTDYGASGLGLLGDVDTNGVVDFADLNTVLGRFGLAAPRAVPAPGAIGVTALAALGALRRRRSTSTPARYAPC